MSPTTTLPDPARPTERATARPTADQEPYGPSGPARASRWPTAVQVLVAPLLLVVALAVPVLLTLVPGISRVNDPDLPAWVGSVATVVLSVLVLLVAVAAVALVARLDGRRSLRDLGWRWDRRSVAPLAIGIGVSAAVLLAVGIPLTAAGVLRPDTTEAVSGPLWPALAVGLAQAFLLQGLPEELIFRGYLLRSLRLRPGWAVLVSGLVFGALHLVSQGGQQGWAERIAYLAMPTGFALAAGALVLTTRSLWSAVGVHGGLHLTSLVAGLLAAHGGVPALGDGPVLWCLTGLAWTLVAVVLLVRLRRREHATR